MGNIVELREMDTDDLNNRLEALREEAFNLRFQIAGRQLNNTARVKKVRRETAQILSLLHNRQLAVETAATHPDIANALRDKEWKGKARFVYEETLYNVSFDANGEQLATAKVDLNVKRPKTRRERALKGRPKLVVSYKVA